MNIILKKHSLLRLYTLNNVKRIFINCNLKSRYLCFILFSLLFSIGVHAQSPGVVWQKVLGGSKNDVANDVLLNPDGTMIVVGFSASNDGNITGHHGTTATYDAWVVKLDANGNIMWQHSIGGTANDYFNTVINTNDTAYLCTGFTYSNDGDVTGNHGMADMWAVKISKGGSIMWSECYGGSKNDTASDAVMLHDGSFALLGTSLSTNGDVNSGNTSRTKYDAWVIKTAANGSLLWEKCLGDSAKESRGINIAASINNKIVAYVDSAYTYSYIPAAMSDPTYATGHKGVLYQLDAANGAVSFIGKAAVASAGYEYYAGEENMAMYKNNSGFYFSYIDRWGRTNPFNCTNYKRFFVKRNPDFSVSSFTSTAENTCDAPPETYDYQKKLDGNHGLVALSNKDIIIAGNYNLVYPNLPAQYGYVNGPLQASGYESLKSIKVFPSDDEFVSAGYASNTSDNVAGHGGVDFWIVKTQSLNKITGNIFIDYNHNNQQDAGEPPFSQATVITTGQGQVVWGYGTNGQYANLVGKGTYKTAIKLFKPYYQVSTDSTISTFTTFLNNVHINYPVHPIIGSRDYAVAVAALTIPRPGFNQQYAVTYANHGVDTLLNKKIVFIKSNHTQFLSSVPEPTSNIADTITWNIDSLLPDENSSIIIHTIIDAIPLVNINDTLKSSFYIDSTADVFSLDNKVLLNQLLVGSYDPNDKKENYAGNMPLKDAVDEKYITYTIRFQNTGTDTAFNIVVRDTLDAKLDSSSFEMIKASHSYQVGIKEGKYIAWKFNDIKLLDSFNNEALSHGYINYRIKAKPLAVIGDIISNRAAIYFDFNPAVLTNNQLTKIIGTPTLSIWIGSVSVAWENPLNWSNNKIPDANTEVKITATAPHLPEINSNANCYSIKIDAAATLLIKAGFKLNVAGKSSN